MIGTENVSSFISCSRSRDYLTRGHINILARTGFATYSKLELRDGCISVMIATKINDIGPEPEVEVPPY